MTEGFLRKVANTAYAPAYARTFTRIPLALETRAELACIAGPKRKEQEATMIPLLIPFFEARYLLTNRLLKESGVKQILEIGAGLSFRGALMSASDSSIDYKELDQPFMVDLKRRIMFEMAKYSPWHKSLMDGTGWETHSGNALDPTSFDDGLLSGFVPGKQVAVVNEGLLPYFSHQEKAQLGRNIHDLSKRFSGVVWITPDIFLSRNLGANIRGYKANRKRWHKSVGKNLDANAFSSEQEALKFFEGLGFSVSRRSLCEVANELISPERLGISTEQLLKVLSTQPCLVMTAR